MTEWKAKRFWSAAKSVALDTGGWQVELDGRPVRTPAKAPMILPTAVMADAVAAEWDAQDKEIKPLTMPVTRSANAAIDRVVPQKAEVAAMLAAYAETDLLCHRADSPAELVERQSQGWDALLDWAREELSAPLIATAGILAVAQPPQSLSRIAEEVASTDEFQMTALHDLVSLSGSVVLGLAVAHKRLSPQEAWDLSRIDEVWQIEQWGEDEEATELAQAKCAQFLHAAWFWTLSSTP